MNPIKDRLLVTGANGQLGRAVVEELLRLGATHVVAATRTPEKLGHLSESVWEEVPPQASSSR